MHYELIDLGKPHEKIWSKAFVHTPNRNLLIKGGWQETADYLRKSGIPYFGKRVNYTYNPYDKVHKEIEIISGNGLKVLMRHIKHHKIQWWQSHYKKIRAYYEFRDEKYNVLFKSVRRLPTKWIKEIFLDVDDQVLVASDRLREEGFDFAAQILLDAHRKVNKRRN